MADCGGKTGEIVHAVGRFTAFSAVFDAVPTAVSFDMGHNCFLSSLFHVSDTCTPNAAESPL